MYKFTAASENERIVFGSARPGYTSEQVNEWIEFMQNQGIQRVCCLLPESQLTTQLTCRGRLQKNILRETSMAALVSCSAWFGCEETTQVSTRY